MYKIYADNHLIYDSTIEDYKIGKGTISLETDKNGSFTFSLYPDHFYYKSFVKLKTVITVYKSDRIVFRGRILNDTVDYWNNKVITCEGELGFLNDSIIRPYEFAKSPAKLFEKFIAEHNEQVDDFKKFKLGSVTIEDANDYIARSNSNYESALNNLNSALVGSALGGHFYITHGEDGTDEIPTIHYLKDFVNLSDQTIEFGSNLKNYTKTVKADDIATAIIPLGKKIENENDPDANERVNIKSVNNGKDYVFEPSAVAMYGWIFKVVEWDDVGDPSNLKDKAEALLLDTINQNITIELGAIDLHLLDRSIDSFRVGDYIQVASAPHDFNAIMLCNKQTLDLLKPENDTVTLGHTYSGFTGFSDQIDYSGAITDAKSDLLRKISAHDLAVERLTALMAMSLGVFKTEEKLDDGSVIYYMHDAQTLGESKTIWKMTADAFAVSTDGGKTYHAGLDKDGNAVVNVLSAVGIKTEWLDTDEINAKIASIGGWSVGADGIYKDTINSSDSSIVHRIAFTPPINGATRSVVLSCRKSTNGGKTFSPTFALYSDGRVRFANTWLFEDGRAEFGDNTTIYADGSAEFGDNVVFAADGSAQIGAFRVEPNGSVTIDNMAGANGTGIFKFHNVTIYGNGVVNFDNEENTYISAAGSAKFGNTEINSLGEVIVTTDNGMVVRIDKYGIRLLDEDGNSIGGLVFDGTDITAQFDKLVVNNVVTEDLSATSINGGGYDGYIDVLTSLDGGIGTLTVNNGIITNYSSI